MSPILAILLPSMLPSARFELVLAAIREVTISGIEVATDITVSPMTTGLILLLTEIDAEPEVNKSLPYASAVKPTTRSNKSSQIGEATMGSCIIARVML